jgi:hypothetical protein
MGIVTMQGLLPEYLAAGLNRNINPIRLTTVLFSQLTSIFFLSVILLLFLVPGVPTVRGKYLGFIKS